MSWYVIGRFFRSIPLRVYAYGFLALVVLSVAWVLVDGYGDKRAAEVQAKWDRSEAAHAAQAARQADEARKTEERHRADYAAAVARLRDQQRIADEKYQADVAALRSGALRLRDRFRCPAPGLPGTPAVAGGVDGAGERGLLVADQELLLQLGREADAVARRLNALQEAVRAGQR